ncbi:MAG TPA: hypothetical protein VIQ81_03240 [Gammaproteobacteria bacterium]
MKTNYALISIIASTLFLTGMSSPVDHASEESTNGEMSTTSKHQHTSKTGADYTKPHAGIDLRYQQPGRVEPGETVTLELNLSSRMAGDLMQVRIKHDSGLQLNTAAEHEFATSQGQQHTLPVSVTALQEGRLHLDVLVSVRVDGKFQSRAFSILLNVGDPARYKSSDESKPLPEGYKLDRERGVISMPAVESSD